jgi:SAM-dependent methyltransferase
VTIEDLPRLLEAQYAAFTEDLPFWISLAREAPGPALELGCGPGRVLRALADAGFEVDGLDHDPEMLRRAGARSAAGTRGRPRLILGDLRDFHLDKRYSLIIVPCNTFASLAQPAARESLACAHRHLTRGGAFAAEMPSSRAFSEGEVDPHEPLDEFLEPERGNPVQVYAEQHADRGRRLIRVTWRYDELHPDGEVERTEVPIAYHRWDPGAIEAAARGAGFASLVCYGDYDRSPYDALSPRLIAVARAGHLATEGPR